MRSTSRWVIVSEEKLFAMFGLWKAFRRRKLLKRPVPETWIPFVEEYLFLHTEFSPEQKERFWDHLKVLLWEKHWVGAAGFELSERTRVIIAAQGARMGRGLPLSIFDRLQEFVIYGEDFIHPDDDFPDTPTHGEAHPFGTVVLSWPAVLEGLEYPCSGYSPVLHELAHILDLTNGYFDGTPLLHSGKDYQVWGEVFQKYFDQIRARPEESFLDLYGAGDEAEFFAVATESFFGIPEIVREAAPDLFELLAGYYRVEPVEMECSCESHDRGSHEEEEEMEEVGMPLFFPKDPLDNGF